jgi:hypothetical protein
MSYDSLLIVFALIGLLSAVFFVLGLASDVLWPLLEARTLRNKRQATYTPRRHP